MKRSFSLLPRQDQFYDYLTDLAAQADAAAHHLKSYVDASDADRRRQIGRDINACRLKSKEIMNSMTGELCRSFVTPFDREDMQNFAQALYRIPKIIEKAVQRMELHGLKGAEGDFRRQTALIVDEAALMGEMVSDLVARRNTKKVVQKVAELHDLEQRGDDVLQELLSSLFSEGREVKDLLLRKDIYDLLEKIIDCYRDAAAVTLQIVLKYS